MADDFLPTWGPPSDDDVAARSAAARSRRRWLRQQAQESATLAGVLVARAERDEVVTLECGPWRPAGRLRSVTSALCVLECVDGAVVLVPTEAVTAVEGPGEVVDDRSPAAGPDLAGVLATLVGERPAVRLLLGAGTEVAGSLVGVGKDAVTVEHRSAVASVRLSAVAACVLLDRRSTEGRGSASGR